jgi:hypothetical protein
VTAITNPVPLNNLAPPPLPGSSQIGVAFKHIVPTHPSRAPSARGVRADGQRLACTSAPEPRLAYTSKAARRKNRRASSCHRSLSQAQGRSPERSRRGAANSPRRARFSLAGVSSRESNDLNWRSPPNHFRLIAAKSFQSLHSNPCYPCCSVVRFVPRFSDQLLQ